MTSVTSTSQAVLAALASGDDDRARRLLRTLIGVSDQGEWSSTHLPPSIRTAKAFAKICASGVIAGAVQDGKRGPWRCSREAWSAARSRRPAPRIELVHGEKSDEELAELALAGIRAGRRA
jgi:hypothetical protein